ncbi:MAG: tRNA pseudouridine38-40 synthase [Myxococcota bacterium]|jgi:tRNA pseudouridine38-40 synthase
MPVSFCTQSRVPLFGWVRGLNGLLPHDASVIAAGEIDPKFDVRHSAKGKVYRYTIWNGTARSALLWRRAWSLRWPLDLDAMRRAAAVLVGDHDFSSFRASGCQSNTPTRRITDIRIEGQPGGRVDIFVEGNAFLQHMVRIIVGTLVDVGRSWEDEAFTTRALAARDRTKAGQTAPSRGLTLMRVLYETSPFTVGDLLTVGDLQHHPD